VTWPLHYTLTFWLHDTGWLTVLLGLALLFAGLVSVRLGFGNPPPALPTIVPLAGLCQRWARPSPKVVHIAELVHLWRAQPGEGGEPLAQPRARAFARQLGEWAFFSRFPLQQAVCTRIVQLLDREGLCPSVVDTRGDVEAAWDATTYRILAKTTLLDHSLNVAEQVVRLLSEQQAWHVIPDTMVAALGHDLGKLGSQKSSLYALGEHPLAAGKPLAGIAGFKELERKEEILRAIKLHHKLPEGLLGATLKRADQLARQQELEETVEAHEPEVEQAEAKASPVSIRPVINGSMAARQAQVDIFNENPGTHQKGGAAPLPPIDISGWFDAAAFLKELRPAINRLAGRRFAAFSMADGHVYFQVKVLEEVARKQAERAGCMEIATMAGDDLTMRRVLCAIVDRLRREEVIARGLIREGYFGGYFLLTRKFGKELKGYYTPFHAEAFGSIAEMERDKPDLLRGIVKVSPYLGGDQES
jgi:hypothetical protein